MWCIITKFCYTGGEDFGEADAVYPDLGDTLPPRVTVRDLERFGSQAR